MNKKTVNQIIFSVSCVVFIICAIILFKMFMPEKDTTSIYKNEFQSTVASASTEETEIQLPDNPIDFASLKETNQDVYSWIEIPDTNVDYPVVQAGKDNDDLFYLDHNINKEYEFAGMIFSQKKNSKNYSDPVTVLYGHDMRNGSMFKDLHKFEDKEFFDTHDTIYIYTPGHILTYKIISAYVYDNRHILNTFNFSEKKDIKEYFNSIKEPKSMTSNVREGVSLTVDDKVLTLSTCTSSDSQRFLVQGVLTNDEPTK